MAVDRTPMREQDPKERARNFQEVSLGYNEEEAKREAKRCLQCKNPRCVAGCPVGVQIPQFIQKIVEGDFDASYDVLKETNSLPAVCGRVCPQEIQCEARCILGIKGEPVAIGRLERYAADRFLGKEQCELPAPAEEKETRVAVVGAGPAGLTCAGALRRLGYRVTVFEALHRPGGVLVYGIPEFRLPKALVAAEVKLLEDCGVELELDTVIGRTILLDELFEEGYRAVFVGSGAGLPVFLNIPGEDLCGVYSANEVLTRVNLMQAYREDSQTPVKRGEHVVVIGGGNVAMDAARSALRLGARVTVVYRRTMEEMPARVEEVHHAQEEGIEFLLLCNPLEIQGAEGWVTGLRCERMALGEPDASGRRRPVPVPDSAFEVSCDQVILALGTRPNPLIASTTPGLSTDKRGCLLVDEATLETSREGVYAGGDAVTGAATVILAMGAGRKAAQHIHEALGAEGS